jgi:hypothetical protein
VAVALDADLDGPVYADEVARRRVRLEQLNAAP